MDALLIYWPYLLPLVLLVTGYLIGGFAEARHYASIREREQELLQLPAVTFEDIPAGRKVAEARLVNGSVVVSVDYFKRFLAALRNIFGGRVSAYETLIDRARREAVLRMKAECREASLIANVRIQTARIGDDQQRNRGIGAVEVHAYGTAVVFR